MILVAGGTGRLGTLVVRRLAARGCEVRVLTRDPARAAHLGNAAAEVVRGDVRDAASLAQAMRGVTTVISAVHGFAGPGGVTPASVDRDGNAKLVRAAAASGAEVVMVSIVGAAPDSPMELFRAKFEAERQLRASGVRWTIVRATAFVELWAEIMRKPIVFGRGDNPNNFVSVDDVAAVVERVSLNPQVRGVAIDVGGPENLSFNQLAALVLELRGGSGRVRHVPRWLLRVLAPLVPRVRAALVMDTVDMTFDVAAARGGPVELPLTPCRVALGRAAMGAVAAVPGREVV